MNTETQAQTVQLETLKVESLSELQGWKEKQQEIVKHNPFVAIEDTKTYDAAKKHRTALVSARTDVQKQEKTIASKIKDFRTKVANASKELIAITQPHEDKQQDEVKRYEAEKEAERVEKERIEQERKEAIQKGINDFYTDWKTKIQSLNFDGLESANTGLALEIEKRSENEMEEFEMDFSEKTNLLIAQLKERKIYLTEKEEARKEAEKLAAERAAFEKEQKEAREKAAKEEAERKAKLEKEESERKAQEEKERAAREAEESKFQAQREKERAAFEKEREELEAEKQRLAKEEAERLAKIEAERKSKADAEAKAKAEKEEAERKKAEEKRLKALQPDKEKIRDFIFSLRFGTEPPKVKDANSEKFLDEIQNDIEAWKNRVMEEVDQIK